VGERVAGWVASGQQAQVNVSAALDVARRFTPEETVELSSATAVPLMHGQEVLGVLAVYPEGYSVLTEHHVQVLNVLAERAFAAIHNALRLERQREMAYTDPLTGLANSRQLRNRASAKRWRSYGGTRSAVRSAAMRPRRVTNLKPWPEVPPITRTRASSGSRSRMKSSFGVLS
jgi:hypothetical protein